MDGVTLVADGAVAEVPFPEGDGVEGGVVEGDASRVAGVVCGSCVESCDGWVRVFFEDDGVVFNLSANGCVA